jgi:hypothetical protein
LTLAHQILGALRIGPKFGLFGGGIQFGKTNLGAIPVKDASSAGRQPA